MKIVKVELSQRPYPIFIGSNLLHKTEVFSSYIQGKQVFIVCDQNTQRFLPVLQRALGHFHCDYLVLPAGEVHKTLDSCNQIWTALLQKQQDRTSVLCALGGGVIGDLTGFAAACYRRGVDFIQFPTTLLAQVDAAIGGKTGVNHIMGKNMIGAFHQPKCVVIDISTLKSLAKREFIAGLAEVIKYGLIADPKFFSWLENNTEAILARDEATLIEMIEQSCKLKAKFVACDEFEQNERALLNLGHSFGHVIETATAYKEWLHGEAVAIGIVLAADLSVRQGLLSQLEFDRIYHLIKVLGLPTQYSPIPLEKFLSLLYLDKKVLKGNLRLILLRQIGAAFVSSEFDFEKLKETILISKVG